MPATKSTYQQILKSTTLFGGVQVFNILVSVLRSKCIALFIGPLGMGVSGLLMATLNLVSGFTSLGLETSAVKFLSEDHAAANTEKVSKTLAVLRKVLWMTGLAGAVLFFVFSPLLSQLAFGNEDYRIAFRWISVALFLKQIAIGELALLQGLQQLRFLAKANFYGSAAGLAVSLPFYYYLKLEAIVPAIIITTAFAFFFSFYYAKKVDVPKSKVKSTTVLKEGKAMLQLGIVLSISAILTLATTYAIQIYITGQSGLTEVGYYNAGFALLNSYVGIIFTSMATDYFPRLSAVNNNAEEVSKMVSQQAMVAVLIITPIVVLFLAFAPFFVELLFSSDFLAIVPMACIGILAMIFRAVSWSMGYIILAKGDSKVFVWNALGFNTLFLALHLAGYYYYGLQGLGMAFLVYYFFHYAVIRIMVGKWYGFRFSNGFNTVFAISILIALAAFLLDYMQGSWLKYGLFGVLILISAGFSLYHINRKMNISELIGKFASKLKGKSNGDQ